MSNPNAIINSDYGPIIININDLYIGKHISKTGYWAKEDIILIMELIDFLLTKKKDVVFYDIGANIGTHTLAIGKTYGSKVFVRAFEAQRQIFNMLCGTIAINGLQNIYCHNLAISDESGQKLEIPVLDYNETNNFGGLELIQPPRSDNQNIKKNGFEIVETVNVDSFNEAVDFIKIDIEGMEDKALAGAMQTLQKYRPICFVEILKTDIEFLLKSFITLGYAGFQKNAELIAIPAEYDTKIDGLERSF